jgi:hypothetical protein
MRALLAGVVTIALAVAGIVVAAPAAASGNSLDWGDGTAQRTFGASDSVTIDLGTLVFDNACPPPADPDMAAVQDFVYPISDVYIVPAGSTSPGDAAARRYRQPAELGARHVDR